MSLRWFGGIEAVPNTDHYGSHNDLDRIVLPERSSRALNAKVFDGIMPY